METGVVNDWPEDGAPGWEMQEDNEARRFQEEQLRRDAEAFERLMNKLWSAMRSQWRQENAKSE